MELTRPVTDRALAGVTPETGDAAPKGATPSVPAEVCKVLLSSAVTLMSAAVWGFTIYGIPSSPSFLSRPWWASRNAMRMPGLKPLEFPSQPQAAESIVTFMGD